MSWSPGFLVAINSTGSLVTSNLRPLGERWDFRHHLRAEPRRSSERDWGKMRSTRQRLWARWAHSWWVGGRNQSLYGGFRKWWYPTTMGFPTKNEHFGVFWGYHYFWKHPYILFQVIRVFNLSNEKKCIWGKLNSFHQDFSSNGLPIAVS